jgi:hypothetical protein
MSQSRRESFIEAALNVAIGYGVALGSQLAIFPIFGIHVTMSTNLWIGAWFTAISLARSFIIRRWFNARLHRAAQRLAGSSTQKEPGDCGQQAPGIAITRTK